MSKKARRIIIPVVVLVIVAAIVVVGLKVLRDKKTASVSTSKTGASSVYVVAKKDVATLTTVSGTIHPVRYATLTAQAAGTFTAVYKKEGDAVKAGEVIALIDSAAHDIQLAQAESSYRQSLISFETADTTDLAATKTQLETAVKQAEIQQLSAENNLKSAIDDDTNAQTVANLEEQVTKAGENLATAQSNLKYLQDHDTSEQQLMLSDASVRQAELSLNTAQTRLATLLAQDVTEEQLAALEAQVRQAKSSLLSAQLSLDEAAQSSTTSDARLTLMQDQVDEAQISLETAESNLKNASADNKASQTDIDAQKAAVESAKTGLENAEASYESTEASLDQRKLNLDAAQLQVTQAERAVTDAKNNVAANQKTIDATASNVELLKANVDQAKAAVALAQSSLAGYSDTVRKAALQADALKEQKKQTELSIEATRLESENYVVKAPYDCVITALSVKVGDEASSGTTVAVVADTTVWNISAYVDEVDVLSVKTGQDASVTMDAYSNQTFTGKVTYVGHALTTTSTSVSAYPVTVQVTKPPQTIVDGMSADASIAIAVAKGALAVPIEAVLTENGKTYVTLVSVGADKTTTMTKTEVKTGIEGDEYVEIKSGLKAGDRVLRTVSTTSTTTTTETQPGGLDIPGGIVPGGTGGPGGPGGN